MTHRKINLELIDKARAIAHQYVPIDGEIHTNPKPGTDKQCLCGIGLLLAADGQDPSQFSLTEALHHFGVTSGGDELWGPFDEMVIDSGGHQKILDSRVFEEWLNYVVGMIKDGSLEEESYQSVLLRG